MSIVVVRPRALTDLAEIWAYIARQSADDSLIQADAFVDLVDRKFQALSRRPGIGRRRPELAPDIRSFSVGRYVSKKICSISSALPVSRPRCCAKSAL